jgi:shikimate kinase
MGCGKTTVGGLLARGLGWPFIDLDATIEAGQRMTIKEMFEQAGEPFFRAVEHAALAEASKTEPAVIALGGGTFVQKSNLDLIRAMRGTTIWLDCPVEELRRRCETVNNRPLFRDRSSFEQLFAQRLPYYQLAEHRISTAGRTPAQIVEQIVRLLTVDS